MPWYNLYFRKQKPSQVQEQPLPSPKEQTKMKVTTMIMEKESEQNARNTKLEEEKEEEIKSLASIFNERTAMNVIDFYDNHKHHLYSPTNTKIVEIDTASSPMDAAKVLWKYDIRGAPVWDSKQKKYCGYFDARDVLSAMVAAFARARDTLNESIGEGCDSRTSDEILPESSKASHPAPIPHPNHHLVNVGMVEDLRRQCEKSLGPSISYLAARNPIKPCQPSSTVKDICELMVKSKEHRVPVSNISDGSENVTHNKNTFKLGKLRSSKSTTQDRYIHIVSQPALIQFLHSKLSCLNQDDKHYLPQQKLCDSQLNYKKSVVSIRDTSMVIEAFELMDSHRLSGIAVVDEDGQLIHNMSARDIELALTCDIEVEDPQEVHLKNHKHRSKRVIRQSILHQDVVSYLSMVRQRQVLQTRYPACHVHEKDTISHILERFSSTGYHHIFVVDENHMPIGVISITDILAFFLKISSETIKNEINSD